MKLVLMGLLFSAQTLTQACPDGDHKIAQLPYWNSEDAFPCTYAGTFATAQNESVSHNLFYWLFKNTSITNAPLVLWLNGGPGQSSLFGLFVENGPLRIQRNGTGQDDFIIGLTPGGSWLEMADMIYLDQPVGTGFSWGDSYLTTIADGVQEMINFFVKFLNQYPEYKTRDIYISGESYAGKYLPELASKISDYNIYQKDNVPAEQQILINLKGAIIGDPYVSPIRQRQSTYVIAQGTGALEEPIRNQVMTLRRRCEETISTNWTGAYEDCDDNIINYVTEMGGDTSKFDATLWKTDISQLSQIVKDYLRYSGKTDELYEQIHILESTKKPKFSMSSTNVKANYKVERLIEWSQWYDKAMTIDGGLDILLFAGEYDQIDGPFSQFGWLEDINFFDRNNRQLWKQPRKIYYYKNDAGEYEVGGYYRTDQRFTFLTVPKGGHFLSLTNMIATKRFLADFINNKALSCHNTNSSDCETGPIMCSYMNNCTNQGTCNDTTGKCQCNQGYIGSDCSKQVNVMSTGYSKTLNVIGNQWTYLQFADGVQKGSSFQMVISSSNPMDVYLISGTQNDPHEFLFDLHIKSKQYFVLNSTAMPQFNTFTIALRANGFDSYNSALYQTSIRTTFDIISNQQSSIIDSQNNHTSQIEVDSSYFGKFKKLIQTIWASLY